MTRIIPLFVILVALELYELKKCTDITKIIDEKEYTWVDSLLFNFKSSIRMIIDGGDSYLRTTYSRQQNSQDYKSFGIKGFLIESDQLEDFEATIDELTDYNKPRDRHDLIIHECYIYNKDVTIAYALTEDYVTFGWDQSRLKGMLLISFDVYRVKQALEITSIIDSYHYRGKNLMNLSLGSFYGSSHKDGTAINIKFFYLQNEYPSAGELNHFSTAFADPLIASEDYPTNLSSDIYALGMIIHSLFYGEEDFSGIAACSAEQINPEECAQMRYNQVLSRHTETRNAETHYPQYSLISDGYSGANMKKDLDMLIESMVSAHYKIRPNTQIVTHLLENIKNKMEKGEEKRPTNSNAAKNLQQPHRELIPVLIEPQSEKYTKNSVVAHDLRNYASVIKYTMADDQRKHEPLISQQRKEGLELVRLPSYQLKPIITQKVDITSNQFGKHPSYRVESSRPREQSSASRLTGIAALDSQLDKYQIPYLRIPIIRNNYQVL